MISFWSTEHRARDGVRIYSPQKLLRLVSNLPWWLDGKFGGWKERTQNLNIQPGPYFIHTFNNINCNRYCFDQRKGQMIKKPAFPRTKYFYVADMSNICNVCQATSW